jgi:hypothetical protein
VNHRTYLELHHWLGTEAGVRLLIGAVVILALIAASSLLKSLFRPGR